mmetsp:Transcript_30681/g.76189  ORF Transcript_30681/g.76189 Transcript_30681/m.76189 type:complete len:394 (-) Transcript_30681:230-1411(-)
MKGSMVEYQGYWEACTGGGECRRLKIPCHGKHCDKKDTPRHPLQPPDKDGGWRHFLGLKEERAMADIDMKEPERYWGDYLTDLDELDEVDLHDTSPIPWHDSEELRKFTENPSSIIQILPGDIISLGRLLSFAGVDLDSNVNQQGESRRAEGLVLSITIKYTNLRPFMTLFHAPIEYVYSVQKAPSYKTVETEKMSDTHRVLYNRHGIFIDVHQQGNLATFNFSHMLIVLTTSLALLGAATAFTDFCAESLMKHSDEYKQAREEVTKDFSEEDTHCLCWFRPGEEPKDQEKELESLEEEINNTTTRDQVNKELLEKLDNVTHPYNTWREACAILLVEVSALKKKLKAAIKDLDVQQRVGFSRSPTAHRASLLSQKSLGQSQSPKHEDRDRRPS